jgi:hypothetical protein
LALPAEAVRNHPTFIRCTGNFRARSETDMGDIWAPAPDLDVTSVNYDFAELLSRAEAPF